MIPTIFDVPVIIGSHFGFIGIELREECNFRDFWERLAIMFLAIKTGENIQLC